MMGRKERERLYHYAKGVGGSDKPAKDELDLLRSYEKGPRIWDATAILPAVCALADKGLIEPVTGTNGAYQLTEAGRAALRGES